MTWRFDMKIRDVMTRTAELTTPDDTLRHFHSDVGQVVKASGVSMKIV